jgi:hypothetical protein
MAKLQAIEKVEEAAVATLGSIESLLARAKGFKVRSAVDAQGAADLQKEIRATWKTIEEERKARIEWCQTYVADANDFYKRNPGPLAKLEEAGNGLKVKLTKWTVAEQEKEKERQAVAARAAEKVRLKEL